MAPHGPSSHRDATLALFGDLNKKSKRPIWQMTEFAKKDLIGVQVFLSKYILLSKFISRVTGCLGDHYMAPHGPSDQGAALVLFLVI